MKIGNKSKFFSIVIGLAVALLQTGCGGESREPSAAQKALDELQQKYEEVTGDSLDRPVQWASDDLENIGDWEYKVVDISAIPAANLETELNVFGDDRWEMIWVDESGGRRQAVFKRPAVSLLSKIPLSQLGRIVIGNSESER